MKIKFALFFWLLWTLSCPSYSDDYNHIATDTFWNQLYQGGGWSLYCGYRFDQEGNSPEGYSISIDHVYDTEWMLDALHCTNRTQCYTEKGDAFVKMESDLHNLYPAWSDLTVYRTGRTYGEVAGEDWRFDNCDFEWKAGLLEPRPLSRGNIARSVLYMHTKYNLPVSPELMQALKEWNREDLPSEQERVRNDRIEKIQGQRNRYIDDPDLIEKIGVISTTGR